MLVSYLGPNEVEINICKPATDLLPVGVEEGGEVEHQGQEQRLQHQGYYHFIITACPGSSDPPEKIF